MQCRHCNTQLHHTFLDLGSAPPSNAYLDSTQLNLAEIHYPLRVMVCEQCWLVQTQDYADASELFDAEYAYFSSVSESWLKHASHYCTMITGKLGLTENSQVVELASNDGYLLRNFVAQDIPCLGIEPTTSTAAAARELGIPVVEAFFGEALANELLHTQGEADLIIGNNVFAHVPDINDFSKGISTLLAKGGTVTLEFPHLMRLIEFNQFDTVYHEHFSYLSLTAVSSIFNAAGLKVIEVEELSTHGGSLRVYGARTDDPRAADDSVQAMLTQEQNMGLTTLDTYLNFQHRADDAKNKLLQYLIAQKQAGKRIAAYGAAAKGNTLLNYAGVKTDLIDFVCDGAQSKQGQYMPGSHIPILAPEAMTQAQPDIVLILPWNIAAEIQGRIKDMLATPCRVVTAIPELKEL